MFSGGKRSFPDPEIPVWVEGRKKWVTGISKRTTFDDIVFALLRHQLGPSANGSTTSSVANSTSEEFIHHQLQQYNIVEVREEIERPLKGSAKVMKVWRAWSSSKARITLFLRKMEQIIQQSKEHDTQGTSFFQRLLSRRTNNRRSGVSNNLVSHNQLTSPFGSPMSRISSRQPIDNLIAKDKLLTSQLNKINEINREIIHLENHIGTNDSITSEDDRDFIVSLFPSLSPSKFGHFSSLSHMYYGLSQELDNCQKTSNNLENVLNTEMQHFNQPSSDNAFRWSIESDDNDDCSIVKKDVYASRELSRIQCKEVHDLELNMRDLERSLENKKHDLNRLESMLLTRVLDEQLNQTDESGDDESMTDLVANTSISERDYSKSVLLVSDRAHHLPQAVSPVWIKKNSEDRESPRIERRFTTKIQSPLQPGDTDSGINSMTSEENPNSNHLYASKIALGSVIHQNALETLV